MYDVLEIFTYDAFENSWDQLWVYIKNCNLCQDDMRYFSFGNAIGILFFPNAAQFGLLLDSYKCNFVFHV